MTKSAAIVYNADRSEIKTAQGRWSRLTPELQKNLIDAVAMGLFENQIAVKCGLHPMTLKRWLDTGVAEDAYEPFSTFADDFLRRVAEVEAEAVALIRQAGEPVATIEEAKMRGDWKAVAWWLERRHPLRWGTRVTNPGMADSYALPALNSRSKKATAILKKPTPEFLKLVASAGMKLVPADAPEPLPPEPSRKP